MIYPYLFVNAIYALCCFGILYDLEVENYLLFSLFNSASS